MHKKIRRAAIIRLKIIASEKTEFASSLLPLPVNCEHKTWLPVDINTGNQSITSVNGANNETAEYASAPKKLLVMTPSIILATTPDT